MEQTELEKIVKNNIKKNEEDHAKIMDHLDSAIMDLKWMKIISRAILGSILGYFLTLGYFIFENDWANKDDIKELQECIDKGTDLHYNNERRLYKLEENILLMQERIKK